ncbi:hypothetical protein [Simiduia agarivorans]|uniref:Uncharacterized protein n=1 Tax=Simiduia agarivorans (strain DSM 21679 / JCM 13881 / BCRC 17597 / SA1) TaxID=1117647 RepID=K4KLJ0_SIMAS|nr:hypothetical protein [Simiduia agarivorans]AFU99891.1 hypothetical protein M5M_13765 [Simiduia agarivorans SA1 = DSM 21679]
MATRESTSNAARWFVGASLFSLSAALVYFSLQLAAVVTAVDKLLPMVPQLLAQSDDWREEVNRGISLAETQTPVALETFDQTQRWLEMQTPELLQEVAAIRVLVDTQLPPLVAQVDQLQQQLPALLQESAALREALPGILAESAAIRASVPPILAESAALRSDVPLMLAQAGQLADKAGEAGRKATQGAVTGVLRMPFDMLLGAGDLLFGGKKLSDEEVSALTAAGARLLADGAAAGDREAFSAASGLTGSLTIKEKINNQCWRITAYGGHPGKPPTSSDFKACLNDAGEWDFSLWDKK